MSGLIRIIDSNIKHDGDIRWHEHMQGRKKIKVPLGENENVYHIEQATKKEVIAAKTLANETLVKPQKNRKNGKYSIRIVVSDKVIHNFCRKNGIGYYFPM